MLTPWKENYDQSRQRIKKQRHYFVNKGPFSQCYGFFQYADDTTLMAESEEELKSLLMKMKEESEKVGLNSTFRKLRSWHPVPSLHGK